MEIALQYSKYKKGIHWDFCRIAMPKFPLTCAKINDANKKINKVILKKPFHSDQFLNKLLNVKKNTNKLAAFSKETMNPKMPSPSINKGRNQKVNILKNKL